MDTSELSAKYICEDDERLRMALHVYLAMPIVQNMLIKRILEAVGRRFAENHDGVELDDAYTRSLYLAPKGTNELWIYASWTEDRRGTTQLSAGVYAEKAGVYADSVDETQRKEMKERFESNVDVDTWAKGDVQSSDRHLAFANLRGGRWDREEFLRKAILKQDELVSEVVDALERIYKGMFPTK